MQALAMTLGGWPSRNISWLLSTNVATVASLALEKSSDYSRSKRVLDIFMAHLRNLDNKPGTDNGLDKALAKTNTPR
jgi:hypothetical protein